MAVSKPRGFGISSGHCFWWPVLFQLRSVLRKGLRHQRREFAACELVREGFGEVGWSSEPLRTSAEGRGRVRIVGNPEAIGPLTVARCQSDR